MDLLITGGTVVTSAGEQRADLGISEGKIALVGSDLSGLEAEKTLDARGKLVLPGLVDANFFPGGWTPEFMEANTKAAAIGGVTTVFCSVRIEAEEHPSVKLQQARDGISSGSALDWGVHPEVHLASSAIELPAALRDHGVTAVRINLCPALAEKPLSDGELLEIFKTLRSSALAMVKCENGSVVHQMLRDLPVEKGNGPKSHAFARPPWTEAESIRRVAQLASAASAQVMISPVSSPEGLEALRWAKEHFHGITAEVTPMHLTLGRDLLEKEDAHLWTLEPPLRAREGHRSLWRALESGLIDAMSSHHRAIDRELKEEGKDDPVRVIPGWNSVETLLPLLWSDGVEKRRLTPQALVAVHSEIPAKMLGVWPQKGSLDIGADADVVIFDPEEIQDITASAEHMVTDYHPMDGRTMKGWPIMTLRRGVAIAERGHFTGEVGAGEYLERHHSMG